MSHQIRRQFKNRFTIPLLIIKWRLGHKIAAETGRSNSTVGEARMKYEAEEKRSAKRWATTWRLRCRRQGPCRNREGGKEIEKGRTLERVDGHLQRGSRNGTALNYVKTQNTYSENGSNDEPAVC